jgi:hypothetical protein
MKSWLKQFTISNALNERKPLPPAMGRAIHRSEELRRFAENSVALERAFKKQLPAVKTSAELHASIMRAVRAAARAPYAEAQPGWPQRIPASALALLILLGIFLTAEHSRNPRTNNQPMVSPTLADSRSALELGSNLVRAGTTAVMSPMANELQCLDRDLNNTKEFLVASLP